MVVRVAGEVVAAWARASVNLKLLTTPIGSTSRGSDGVVGFDGLVGLGLYEDIPNKFHLAANLISQEDTLC
jgi:hypothetical protein